MHTTRPVVVYLNKIAINKDKSIDESLSEKERIRYNLYLGLSHKAVNLRSSSAAKFSETYDLIAEGGKQNGYIAYNGWLLMEELLSLELANRAFNNNYGYQKIDITNENYLPSELTSTIPKLDGSNNTDNVLAASVNGKLSDILINKYTKENRRFELYSLIYLMGLLNLDKERLYGIDPLPELKVNQSEYKQVLAAINNILDGNTEKNMSDIKTRLRKLKTTHEI